MIRPMGIVVVSMRAARLASCKDNEADFRLKNYKSIFSYLAVLGELSLVRFLLLSLKADILLKAT